MGDAMKTRGFSGFTLVELMIVVVIIAILSALAYPSYQDHVRKSKRAEAKTALLKAAQLLERWYSDNNTYGTTPPPPATPTTIDLAPLFALAAGAVVYSGENPADNKSSYRITAGACPAGIAVCFTLTATPNAAFSDPDCGNLTLNNVGARSWATSPAKPEKCKW
ncbi:MAG TPA: type IV pilin protein [Burkholderiales bacterium]|nr:type IV pilin protein [Burkholderiales bacterium]